MSSDLRQLLSAQAEDYLKTIYLLTRTGKASTQRLADALGITPASVSGMLKKLAELHLIQHRPYYGAVLTEAGERIALEILRHHRLLELYLTEALGYSWDEVHAEADRLEHVISEEFEARINTWLGNPQYDPHGHPIPQPNGSVPVSHGRLLSNLGPQDLAQSTHWWVVRVSDSDAEVLRTLAQLGIRTGIALHVQHDQLFLGSHPLPHQAAAQIWVQAEPPLNTSSGLGIGTKSSLQPEPAAPPPKD